MYFVNNARIASLLRFCFLLSSTLSHLLMPTIPPSSPLVHALSSSYVNGGWSAVLLPTMSWARTSRRRREAGKVDLSMTSCGVGTTLEM